MASSFEKYQKRRLISSYFSVVLSIFLVLFLLGTLGLFLINSKKLSDKFKQEIPLTVFFERETDSATIALFQKKNQHKPYIEQMVYVSKEEAAKNHQETLGENFVEYLGGNPLSDSYDIRFKADYVVKDSISKILKEFKKHPNVASVDYDQVLVDLVNENVKKISFWILVVSGFFAVIAFLLINSSIRISIYANRFIIKTMQMVGATKSFIRKPFILKSVKLGIIGAFIAIIALAAGLYYLDQQFPEFKFLEDYIALAIVFGGILIVGIIITLISTFFATQRFLNLRTDDLY